MGCKKMNRYITRNTTQMNRSYILCVYRGYTCVRVPGGGEWKKNKYICNLSTKIRHSVPLCYRVNSVVTIKQKVEWQAKSSLEWYSGMHSCVCCCETTGSLVFRISFDCMGLFWVCHCHVLSLLLPVILVPVYFSKNPTLVWCDWWWYTLWMEDAIHNILLHSIITCG